jgi:NAD(P)-dependent dehydrogenase (short-subunit alcohol dehydrogenase family)
MSWARHEEVAEQGPATADHVLRIRPWICRIDSEDPGQAIDRYEARYRAWFDEHGWEGLETLEPLPKVFVLGDAVITAGKNLKEARVAGEVALHTMLVASGARRVHGSYRSLSSKDLFDIEYWPLELYKLTLAPPPRELEGRIAVVTGAASGIGRTTARQFASLGAQLGLLDLDGPGLEATECLIREDGNGEHLRIRLDLTEEDRVRDAVRSVVEVYGGIDVLVSNVGIAAAAKLTELDPAVWRKTLEVNTTSHFLITAAVIKVMAQQGLGGSLIYIASKNAFGPGAGFGAYSASKAAQVQLARIAALEGGPLGIRSNVVNPDAVFEDSKLWTDELRRERAQQHGVEVEDLPRFYAERNLLKRQVTSHDVAEAVAFLASDRSQATTGTVITVDGGIPAAFPR